MPRISRHQDRCRTGHRCSPTAPVLASQYTVFANDEPILIRGDKVAPHKIPNKEDPPKCIPHKARLKGSSLTVFVKDIGVGRDRDRADRGRMIQGSHNVFANGF